MAKDRRALPNVFTGAVLLLALLVLVLLSPLALRWFGGTDATWQRLSNIGETYGAAAVLLSAFALVGVAVSVTLQARQARQARVLAQRDQHVQLVLLALESPELFEYWGHPGDNVADARGVSFINLIVSNWEASWIVGSMNEANLRFSAASLFSRRAGRSYWQRFGADRRGGSYPDRRLRRFYDIVDEVYTRALREPARPGWTGVAASVATPPARRPRQASSAIGFFAGLVAGYVTVLWTRRRRRNR